MPVFDTDIRKAQVRYSGIQLRSVSLRCSISIPSPLKSVYRVAAYQRYRDILPYAICALPTSHPSPAHDSQ
jgi:hypothetical protein